MKKCPYCAELIQDDASKCRFCGEWLDGRAEAGRAQVAALMGMTQAFGWDYKTEATLFGLPLIHIASGYDPHTFRPRVARGIIAIGNIAVGVLAVGGLAAGGISLGGLSLGVVALGGVALGGLSAGGLALGLIGALGGLAVSGLVALGGLALAPYHLGGNGASPELLQLLEGFLPAGLR